MSDALKDLMREAWQSYAKAGVDGTNGAIAMRDGLARIEALEARAEAAEAALASAYMAGRDDAAPTDTEINDIAYRMWSIHPKEIAEQGYIHVNYGGKHKNPRQAWYADQIKAMIKSAAIRALPVPADLAKRLGVGHE